MDTNDRPTRGNKRSKSTTRPLKFTFPKDEVSILRGENDTHSEQSNQMVRIIQSVQCRN